MLDGPSQTSTTTTYDDGVWNNGAPMLDVGQAAFFDLEPEPAPEPASSALAGAGMILLVTARKLKRRS